MVVGVVVPTDVAGMTVCRRNQNKLHTLLLLTETAYIGNVIPISRYSGKKYRIFAALACDVPHCQ